MTTNDGQARHDKIIFDLTSYLTIRNFTQIRADLEGYSQPEQIMSDESGDGYTPDLSALLDDVLHIFEVETESTINSEQAKHRWKLFSAYAVVNELQFVLVVPAEAENEAISLVSDLTLGNTLVWTAN